jgi:Collagen triple helix repeat (20 copies)
MLLVLGLCAPQRVWGQLATLVGDAHVSSAQPAVNSGTLSNLNVGGAYTALVQFDLGMLPAGTTAAEISRATLRVYCNRADVPGQVQVELVGGAWTESGVTFATLPAMGATVQTAQVVGVGEFVAFDVTSAVQGWVSAPATNFGLALAAVAGTVVQFDSKENDQTAHAPELEIALAESGTGTVGPQGIQGETGATGAQGPVGPQGEAGLQGAAGISGTGGGIVYQGTYDAGVSYGVGDVVQSGGSSWVSLVAGNVGSTPGSSALTWGVLATAGAQGPAGAAGATGPQGAMGLSVPGPVGPQGVAGPLGAVGPAGSPGLVYQGAYSSAGNYALGDVVVFGGASYVSLTGFNVGQTPGVSAAYWGTLTAQGPAGAMGPQGVEGATGVQGLLGPVGPPGSTGAQGAQGIAGEAGGQGIPGTAGAQGLSGPMGPEGSAGPVGMSYQGAYDSTVNYRVGDGVLWQGAGWVSLIANNHGNTPSLSPGDWGMFAASGVAGAAGAQGSAGTAGLNGLNGLAGAVGPQGVTGAVGPAGSPGLVYRGAYSSTGNYALGDVVVFDGASWVSLVAGNVGETPGVSPADWGVLTSQGPAGVAGPVGAQGLVGPAGLQGQVGPAGPQGGAGPIGIQGPAGAQGLSGATGAVGSAGPQGLPGVAGSAGAQGLTGANGATGAQGATGATGSAGAAGPAGANGTNGADGTPGLAWQGAWSSATNYAVNDAVSFGGASYLSVVAGNMGQRPDLHPASWAALAQAGAAGAIGATGATGSAGAVGAQGATGATGSAGTTGAAGAVGMNFRGVWSAATEYAVKDAVTFAGSTYLAQVAGSNEEPDLNPSAWAVLAQTGGTGATGAQGAAATVTVGTVTTLAAGTRATVNNSGTAQAAMLNFGIPQGAAGSGSGSGSGTSSGSFAAIYHAASFSTLYYAVNTPLSSATETSGSVLAWVPQGCTATELDVYSQQSGAITVTLRAGTPAAMQSTALTCSPVTNGSCAAMGAVVIPAGSFIDFEFDSTTGTTAGVWTSLQCQ